VAGIFLGACWWPGWPRPRTHFLAADEVRWNYAPAGKNQPVGGAVPPGQVHTDGYVVPERAGPGPMDPSSVMWMYHSHTNEVGDDYAGLVGPMIITRAETPTTRTSSRAT
jgi:hypothetical protein